MPDKIPLQFVFQGGGAKLGSLLAVAEAVFKRADSLGFKISRVSGTSAGAIVAAILATGRDPAIFRERLRLLSNNMLDEIVPRRNIFKQLYYIKSGKALYNKRKYREFLRELFTFHDKQYNKFSDLDENITLYMHAFHLKEKENVIYSSEYGDTSLVDALFYSSALPLLFRTFNEAPEIYDGGIVNNFPSEILIKDTRNYGQVIGFSFDTDEAKWEINNIRDFARALILTIMDSSTQQSLRLLDQKNVHLIKTKTTTLQFETAIRDDLGEKYKSYFDSAADFLDKNVRRIKLEAASVDYNVLIGRIMDLHQLWASNQTVHTKSITAIYKSNSLFNRNRETIDECYITFDLEATANPAYTFGIRLSVESRAIDVGNVIVTITDQANKQIRCTVLPLSPELLSDKITSNNIIIIFHNALLPGHRYKMKISSRSTEVLYDLIDERKRRDFIGFYLSMVEQADEINLIVYIPDQLMTSLIEWPLEERPNDIKWVTGGRELTSAELAELAYAPVDYRAIGWRVPGLVRGEGTGFGAVSMS